MASGKLFQIFKLIFDIATENDDCSQNLRDWEQIDWNLSCLSFYVSAHLNEEKKFGHLVLITRRFLCDCGGIGQWNQQYGKLDRSRYFACNTYQIKLKN